MFSAIPFLKLCLTLVLGIISSVFFNFNLNISVVLFTLFSLFIVHGIAHRYMKLIPLFGLIYLIFIFTTGAFLATQQKQKAKSRIFNQTESVIGKIAKTPKIYERFIKTNLNIEAIQIDKNIKRSSGCCLLMIEKDSSSLMLKKGDYIQFEPSFKEIESQKNPEVFNYKRYLFFHLITQQTFLKSKNWYKLKLNKYWIDKNRISDLRIYLLAQYQYYGIKGNALSVLSALTLGYKNELDYNIQQAYAASGAIHVLAVSGLHVGIVFIIINFLLRILGKNKTSRFFRFLFTLIFIWFFAFLTGGAPSVLRASLMFSFIALGMLLKRQNSIYNSIFASAFLLLLYNPFLLFDLSFQLSYSAVLSIVFFQPKIVQLISFKHFSTKWLWSLTSVSLAAQIGTFPITIFYFHQFPNYFLLSNFIVIPLASLIIWLSLLFFFSLKINIIAQFIAYLLQQIILFQNNLIQRIEGFPYSLIKNLYIDYFQLSILILIILSLMLVVAKTKFINWAILGGFILIFFAYSNFLLFNHQQQKKLIVYNIKGVTAINLIEGRNNILITSMDEQTKQKDFNILPNWLSLGLEKEKHISTHHLNQKFTLSNLIKSDNPNFYSKNQFIQFFNLRILYIQNKSILSEYTKQMINLDYIIIGQNTRIDISELNLYFKSKTIIIDSSNSTYNLQFWKTQKAIHPSLNIYIVPEMGAFVKNLNL